MNDEEIHKLSNLICSIVGVVEMIDESIAEECDTESWNLLKASVKHLEEYILAIKKS